MEEEERTNNIVSTQKKKKKRTNIVSIQPWRNEKKKKRKLTIDALVASTKSLMHNSCKSRVRAPSCFSKILGKGSMILRKNFRGNLQKYKYNLCLFSQKFWEGVNIFPKRCALYFGLLRSSIENFPWGLFNTPYSHRWSMHLWTKSIDGFDLRFKF